MAKKGKAKGEIERHLAAIIGAAFVFLFLLLSIGTAVLPGYSCSVLDDPEKSYFIWLPQTVSDEFYGANVNLHFIMPYGNTLDVHGTVKDHAVAPMRCGAPEKRDYDISMTWREALALTGSEEPIRDFVRMWDEGKIIVSPMGMENFEKVQRAREALVSQDTEPVPQKIREGFDKYREGIDSPSA